MAGYAREPAGIDTTRSIPVYEAKGRIDNAHRSIEAEIDFLKSGVAELEQRLNNVLTPVPPEPMDTVAGTATPKNPERVAVAQREERSPLVGELQYAASRAEALALSLISLRVLIHALTARVEA